MKLSPAGKSPAEAGKDRDCPVSKSNARGRPRQFDRGKALEAALALFWRQGYMQTTTLQLCKAMGINSPSLYCAFGSKGKLFLEALVFYRQKYWYGEFAAFRAEPDLRKATEELFYRAAAILLSSAAPCGCMTVLSAMTLPDCEPELVQAVALMREETRRMFEDKLRQAQVAGQISASCDVTAIAGALTNFFEGLALHARGPVSLPQLRAIAQTGVRLLPDPI